MRFFSTLAVLFVGLLILQQVHAHGERLENVRRTLQTLFQVPACDDATVGQVFNAFLDHVYGETVIFDSNYTMSTLLNGGEGVRINHATTATGGSGPSEIYNFYNQYFIPFQNNLYPPNDPNIRPPTVSRDCRTIFFEFNAQFVHDRPLPFFLPGLAPTFKPVAMYLTIRFDVAPNEQGQWKVAGETIFWDQGSVLKQIGLIDQQNKLPILGAQQVAHVSGQLPGLTNFLIECPLRLLRCRRQFAQNFGGIAEQDLEE